MKSVVPELLCCLVVWNLSMGLCSAAVTQSPNVFRAGACAIDITPKQLPVIVNGGFREATSNTVFDRLHSRSLVLDDGTERIVIAVVDSCMVPRDLLDAAKAIASKATGIRMDRMLISSTHTHSAPAAMACLGSDADPNYVKALPGLIAEGIVRANSRLKPARVGWAVIDAPDHTNCRRWILRPDKMRTDPFGEKTVRAHMHPGHQNPSFIGPSAPVDTGLSLLAVETTDGKPLAMFANFSMHYYGAAALSADYCGAFPEEFGKLINAGDGKSGFIAAMTQGTSGDMQWMDYSKPRPQRDVRKYSAELAGIARQAYKNIEYRPWVSLAMAEAKLKLRRRVADESRLEWARKIAATLVNRKPTSQQAIYAREQMMIAADPERELILQAVRIGDLGITAIPNEVYSITGLKLKALSPLRPTFNIELANGGEGYIPPPEQHDLGGYTTWEARTASLETNAEPKIVEALLGLLEKVSGKSRRPFVESPSRYANAVLADKPIAYWRMGELAGTEVADSSGSGHRAKLESGFALHLEGPPGEGFCAAGDINRSVQLAGGKLSTGIPELPATNTIEFWFWNGLPASVREITGVLYSRGSETLALVRSGKSDETVLQLTLAGRRTVRLSGITPLSPKSWHHVALVHDVGGTSLWLDGKEELATKIETADHSRVVGKVVFFGGDQSDAANFEGRIDEVAIYDRALSPKQIAQRVQLSGLSEWREEQRIQARKEIEERARQIAGPTWAGGYGEKILAMKPAVYWPFDSVEIGKVADAGSRKLPGLIDGAVETVASHRELFRSSKPAAPNLGAWFRGGRVKANAKPLPMDYSVSVWFRNDQPNNSRSVTGYFFSRGPDGDRMCPGDHLGIGGTYQNNLIGKLIVFNGNRLDQVVAGKTTIQTGTWNHVVMVRKGDHVTAYLNGNPKPEINAELPASIDAKETRIYFGGRNDNFSNLNGYLDEVAVFDRALTANEAQTLYQNAGIKAPTLPMAQAIVPLDSEPLAPSSALRAIKVRDGYTVELVASEPLVKDPVAVDWGADGRLWVAEMADYPNGMDDNGKPGGRIRVLKDTNGDGRYDQSTVFLEGLNFPNGVMAWQRGVLITAAPAILYAEDTDGDGKADFKKVMYQGFFEGNQQLRVNGLRWGLDNWIYCASGSHRAGYGGKVMIRSHNGKSYEVGSHDFKIRPETGELVPVSGPSQYGRDRDDWGNWFGEQNSYPMWHYVIEQNYLQRNPEVAFDSPKLVLTERNPKVYPAKSPQKRFHSFDQSGRYTSACSAMVYRDDLLFGAGEVTHGFTCEPFHNLVQHHLLVDSGVSFKLSRDPAEKELDFFTSTDRWCRPVQARTGPDGALWVVDMYRYMIEHPQWLPPNGKEELRPHYRAGDDRGRIYRIYPKSKSPRSVPTLGDRSTARLVESLGDSNGTVRDLAQRILIDRKDAESVGALKRLAGKGDLPQGRLQALCTLEEIGRLDASTLTGALRDSHPGVRRHAIRLLETLPKAALSEVVTETDLLLRESDSKARLQLVLTLGELKEPRFGEALARMAMREAGDPFVQAAILSSAPAHYDSLVAAATASGDLEHPLFFELLRMGLKRPEGLAAMLEVLVKPDAGRYSVDQFRLLARWLESLARESLTLDKIARGKPAIGATVAKVESMLDAARAVALNGQSAVVLRTASLQLLGKQPDRRTADLATLAGLLNPLNSSEIQRAAATVMIRGWKVGAMSELNAHWAALLPGLRQSVIDELLSQMTTIGALLQAIESGRISVADLNASQRQRLLKHKDAALRKRAAGALKVAGNADRRKVVEQYRPALNLKADLVNGKAVFGRLCSVCHQPPQGEPVGPDLRSITDKSPEGLLTAILDPNDSSDPRYLAYSIDLKDDTSLVGRIVSETGSSLKLLAADGKSQSILRSQIANLQGSRLSLMPEGLEAGLTPQECADVIGYVQKGLGQ